jgi:uncharacterized protein YndB with AHSA1/START domain
LPELSLRLDEFRQSKVELACREPVIAMSETTLSLQPAPETLTRGVVKEPALDLRISMRVKVNADTRRIFNALTQPEYRELWMRLPGQDQSGRIVALQSKDLFRIDYFQSETLSLTIVGSYLRCRPRKITFNWWKASLNSVSSFVEIRLDRCFDGSILSLIHCGILEKKEYLWHREMWEESLAKLQELFL